MSRLRVIVAIIVAGMISGGAWAAEPTLKWTYNVGSAINSSPAIQDIDGDGAVEFVFGDTASDLIALDGATGREKWSLAMPAPVAQLIIADTDGDGLAEVVVTAWDGRLHVVRQVAEAPR